MTLNQLNSISEQSNLNIQTTKKLSSLNKLWDEIDKLNKMLKDIMQDRINIQMQIQVDHQNVDKEKCSKTEKEFTDKNELYKNNMELLKIKQNQYKNLFIETENLIALS